MRFTPVSRAIWFAGLVASLSMGCATAPYRHGRFLSANEVEPAAAQVGFEYGRPHAGLDRFAWLVGLPSRILPLHPNVNNHRLSDETAEKLATYLENNELPDVLIRVNQYDPAGEWKRLRENEQMASGWRYTMGTLSVLEYTLLPGRVFGGDEYNPFTNSLYINSDVPAVVLVEAAYAKDIHTRRLPGLYATINEFPVLSLWRHVQAVNDVLSYAQSENDWELEREMYRVVYPQMGVHAAAGGHTIASVGAALPLLSIPVMAIGGAIVGHTYGQITIAQRESELHPTSPAEDTPQTIQLTGHAESPKAAFPRQ